MSFHENAVFPEDVGYGTSGGPGHNTLILTLDSGAEQRLSKWNGARRQYDVTYDNKEHEKLSILQRFVIARRGSTYGFRIRDWYDCTSGNPGLAPELDGAEPTFLDILIGEGDGDQTDFQLVKYYEDAGITRTRSITKPKIGSVLIALDEVEQLAGWSVNTATGLVTFTIAPGAGVQITAGFEFDVPVRITEESDKQLKMAVSNFGSGDTFSMTMIEIMDTLGVNEERYLGGSRVLTGVSEDITLSALQECLLVVAAIDPGLKIKLPDIVSNNLPGGAPYYYIVNSGAESIDVYKSDGVVLVGTLDPGDIVVVCLDKENNMWYMG